jgi:hypothetical protein
MKIPHYLHNSRLFSRVNQSGNYMKSRGQRIWRARARYRNDILGAEAPVDGTLHHHSLFVSSPQQQQQHDGANHELMMVAGPLLWEFVPYERSIIGEPPPACVGMAWQWTMKVHDHWTPRKQVNWSCSGISSETRNGSLHNASDSSSLLPAPSSSSSSNALPRWLSLQGSQIKGTPTEPGIYPILVEARLQGDMDPEPIVVCGNYVIQVFKASTGGKPKVTLPPGNERSTVSVTRLSQPPLPSPTELRHTDVWRRASGKDSPLPL